jgi:hypothetical protein
MRWIITFFAVAGAKEAELDTDSQRHTLGRGSLVGWTVTFDSSSFVLVLVAANDTATAARSVASEPLGILGGVYLDHDVDWVDRAAFAVRVHRVHRLNATALGDLCRILLEAHIQSVIKGWKNQCDG